ncbi:hypothetical protein R1T16_17335 [Flavobacterium sp. DG1-102-2]|uniref:hypothetical protein n=1 Tax=Flavobacterium sp. DG1-102-2 TaxID=3081663 RepID=UPI00294A10A1|nr:hypothetical protein [Flavobacterium sp. DG1-102-2]MDV6170203.1 hypothetical protein [Flavobacterium sp. DG1-102-2]
MKAIYQILGFPKEVYEMLLMNMFFEWCNELAASEKELQKLMSDQSLLNWYMTQLPAYEEIFVNEVEQFGITDKDEIHRHYHRVTTMINGIFPGPILRQARRSVLTVEHN